MYEDCRKNVNYFMHQLDVSTWLSHGFWRVFYFVSFNLIKILTTT
jgi:hypothetical protein